MRRLSATLDLEKQVPMQAKPLQQGDLRWLVCPVCHGALALDTDSVQCSGCGRRYPIVDGIAVLLTERAS